MVMEVVMGVYSQLEGEWTIRETRKEKHSVGILYFQDLRKKSVCHLPISWFWEPDSEKDLFFGSLNFVVSLEKEEGSNSGLVQKM